MNTNEVYPWMLMRKYLLAMLILMLVILMLLNLNTGYADTDADLCIRIMSLCCSISDCPTDVYCFCRSDFDRLSSNVRTDNDSLSADIDLTRTWPEILGIPVDPRTNIGRYFKNDVSRKRGKSNRWIHLEMSTSRNHLVFGLQPLQNGEKHIASTSYT